MILSILRTSEDWAWILHPVATEATPSTGHEEPCLADAIPHFCVVLAKDDVDGQSENWTMRTLSKHRPERGAGREVPSHPGPLVSYQNNRVLPKSEGVENLVDAAINDVEENENEPSCVGLALSHNTLSGFYKDKSCCGHTHRGGRNHKAPP